MSPKCPCHLGRSNCILDQLSHYRAQEICNSGGISHSLRRAGLTASEPLKVYVVSKYLICIFIYYIKYESHKKTFHGKFTLSLFDLTEFKQI